MINSRKVFPFLTLNPSTLGISTHPINLEPQFKSNYLISVIQVKSKDYKLFGNQSDNLTFSQGHGLYITEPIYHEGFNKSFSYLILPSNEGKIAEKYQDLFASFALMVSNVCIFDISSKYVRQSKNSQGRAQRYNYVVMSSHSNGGQIYKANVNTQNNKMQISTKIHTQQGNIPLQLMQNLMTRHQCKNLQSCVTQILQKRSFYKSYLNFDEINYEILASLRLQEHLQLVSKQYQQLFIKQDKISVNQLRNIQICINSFMSPQFSSIQQNMALQYRKNQLIKQIKAKNKSLSDKFVLNLQKLYFSDVFSLKQLQIKRQLTSKILQQYGIDQFYGNSLYFEVLSKLQKKQIQDFDHELYQKNIQINELQERLSQSNRLIQENNQTIKNYEQKNFDFKQMNCKYLAKSDQLQKQRQISRRYKIQVQTILIQLQRRQQIQSSLHLVIKQTQESRQKQNENIAGLRQTIKQKQLQIFKIQQKNEQLQFKIKNYQNLQSQAWKCIQQTQEARDQLQRFKQFLHQLQDHFDAFKRAQIQKFNYILKRNADNYLKLKRENEQKIIIIEENRLKIDKLQGQLQQQRSRLKFCQEQVKQIYLANNSNRKSQIKAQKNQTFYKSTCISAT